MVGFIYNKREAINKGFVSEIIADNCAAIGDDIIITNNHTTKFWEIVDKWEVEVKSEEELINLIN